MNPLLPATQSAQIAARRNAPANRTLRVLLIEDNEDDVALVLRLLRRGGYDPQWRRVQTAQELEDALLAETWDVVLSDYMMPQFDAVGALAMLRLRSTFVPFIVISGSIGEETAVAAMRAGASDYLMKTNLTRLVPAIEREVAETAARRERARTQQALSQLQNQFQVVFDEYLDVMMVLHAQSGEILHVNRAVRAIMGFDENALTGKPFATFWPAERSATPAGLLDRVRREGSVFYSGELSRVDGAACPMDLLANKVHWGEGEAVIVTLRDVSERQRAERRLNEEKEQLAVTLRSIGDGVITADREGRIQLLNMAAARLTGWSQAQAVGRPVCEVLDLFSEHDDQPCRHLLENAIAAGESRNLTRDISLRTRDGRRRSVSLISAPIAGHNGDHNGVVVTFHDCTGELQLEEELQKASRLESVSLLAGGIAHDFNNILTAIMGHISLAQAHVAPAEAVIDKVERACHYATDLTRQLLTFAKGSAADRHAENLATVVRESVEFALHGSKLLCDFRFGEQLHAVEIDRGQIQQVINNLVINAIQATPEGGHLWVDVENTVVTRERPVGALSPGSYVRVSVRDSGSGIPHDKIARIFDPYFTTKPAGSGLGLATSYSIIRKHEGLIRVESTLGHGATFQIYLPASNVASPSASNSAPHDLRKEARDLGWVLFMDDEEVLREMVAAMLEHLGYHVMCAADGDEAIRLYEHAQQTGQAVAAVIVDLTVPGGMGGLETAQRLHEMDAAARVIVSSGYINDPVMTDHAAYGFAGMIAKPYQMLELGEAVRKATTANR